MSDSSCYYYDSDHNHCLCYDNQSLDNLLVENAKLRKENAELRVDIDLMSCQLRARAEERNDLQAKNTKLRELVRDYERCSMHADCDLCEYDGTTSTHCPLSPCFPDIDELCELGIEVKE